MNDQKQSISVPVAIIIAGALIAGGIYFSGNKTTENVATTDTQQQNVESIKPIGPEDHVLGNPKAEIIIVEYSDIECPYCKQFHNTLNQLMKEYGPSGKLAWAFRHFPVHTNSIKEGEAIECAAEIGGNDAFWKYTDTIFDRTQSNNGLDLAQLPIIAGEVGLDVARFEACLDSGKYAKRIEKHLEDVKSAGARGTPYSVMFTKGERIPISQGALPYNDMKTIIETLLKS